MNKVLDAISYAIQAIGRGIDENTAINDAANIFASTYDEYMEIWDALTDH